MQIRNHVKLEGALSRNHTLRSLKQGDSIQVRVLNRINTHTAEIDLRGNRVRAHFQNPVPSDNSLQLQIIGNKDGMLVFTVTQDTAATEAARYTFLTVPGAERFLASLHGEISDMFQLVKNFINRTCAKRGTPAQTLFSRLLKKFSPAQVARLSLLVYANSSEHDLILHLVRAFQTKGEELISSRLPGEIADMCDVLDEDELIDLFAAMKEKKYRQLVLNDNGAPSFVEIAEDTEILAVRFYLSATGEIQIVSRMLSDRIAVDIYYERENFREGFLAYREELDSILKKSNKSVHIRLFDAAEAQKVLSRRALRGFETERVDYKA